MDETSLNGINDLQKKFSRYLLAQTPLRLLLFIVLGIFFVSLSLSVFSFDLILALIYPMHGETAHLSPTFQFLSDFISIFLSSVIVLSIGIPVTTRNVFIKFIKKHSSIPIEGISLPKTTFLFASALFLVLIITHFQSFLSLFIAPAFRVEQGDARMLGITQGAIVIILALLLSATYGAVLFAFSLKKYLRLFSVLPPQGESPKYFSLLVAVGFVFSLLPTWPLILAPVPISILGAILSFIGLIHILVTKQRVGKKLAIISIIVGIIAFFSSFFLLSLTQGLSSKRFEDKLNEQYPTMDEVVSCSLDDSYHYKDLSEIVKSPEKVCSFSIQGENLTLVPEEVRQLKDTKNLHFHFNKLSTLPPWLSELSHVQWLNLSNNNFVTLPDEIYHLPGLKVLVLSGNPISQQMLDTAKSKLPGVDVRYEWAPTEEKLQELQQVLPAQEKTYELNKNAATKEFHDPTTGFSFSYPQEWKEDILEIKDTKRIMLSPLLDNKNTIVITISPTTKDSLGIEAFVPVTPKEVTAGGVAWKTIELNETNAPGVVSPGESVVAASYKDTNKLMGYSIEASFEKKNDAQIRDAFMKVLLSVQLK